MRNIGGRLAKLESAMATRAQAIETTPLADLPADVRAAEIERRVGELEDKWQRAGGYDNPSNPYTCRMDGLAALADRVKRRLAAEGIDWRKGEQSCEG